MVAAAGPTLPGMVWACREHAPSKSAAIPKIWRAFFISSLFPLRLYRRGGQTFFGDDLHGVLDGNLGDAAGFVDPLQLFIGLGVLLIHLSHISPRTSYVSSDPPQPRLRRHQPIILPKSFTRRRR